MHIPTVLYGYNVHAFSLPFTAQHSPSLRRTISTTTDQQQQQEYNTGGQRRKHYYYEYSIPRQLIYSRPRIFIPGLDGFFYRPGYGSTSSRGNG